MGIYLDMHTCADVCTHWNQGMAPKRRMTDSCMWDQTRTHICGQIWERVQQMWGVGLHINTHTDSCTHASHGVGPEER